MRRRHALRSAAALVSTAFVPVALAGCLDDGDGAGDPDPSDHEQQGGSRAVRLSADVRESEEGEEEDDDEPSADYESVTLESSCLDEPRTLEPGDAAVVRREEAGDSCSFTVLVDGEQRHEGTASGAETYDLRVAPDGSVETEAIATV
ncbi:hypothetical protein JCM17823_22250 [Halorubrum gandharaense]